MWFPTYSRKKAVIVSLLLPWRAHVVLTFSVYFTGAVNMCKYKRQHAVPNCLDMMTLRSMPGRGRRYWPRSHVGRMGVVRNEQQAWLPGPNQDERMTRLTDPSGGRGRGMFATARQFEGKDELQRHLRSPCASGPRGQDPMLWKPSATFIVSKWDPVPLSLTGQKKPLGLWILHAVVYARYALRPRQRRPCDALLRNVACFPFVYWPRADDTLGTTPHGITCRVLYGG